MMQERHAMLDRHKSYCKAFEGTECDRASVQTWQREGSLAMMVEFGPDYQSTQKDKKPSREQLMATLAHS